MSLPLCLCDRIHNRPKESVCFKLTQCCAHILGILQARTPHEVLETREVVFVAAQQLFLLIGGQLQRERVCKLKQMVFQKDCSCNGIL